MPHGDPDASDPMTLHGVSIETDEGDANREMARCFIEEFLRMGFERRRLLEVFRKAEYAGPFRAYQDLGESAIVELIDAALELRGLRPGPRRVAGGGDANKDISLRIL